MKQPSRFFHTTMTKYTAAASAAEIKYKQTADDDIKPKLSCKHDRTPL